MSTSVASQSAASDNGRRDEDTINSTTPPGFSERSASDETDPYHVHLAKPSDTAIPEYGDRTGAISYCWPSETIGTGLDAGQWIGIED